MAQAENNVTDARLRKFFTTYNDMYFDNKVPQNTQVTFGKTTRGSDGNFLRKEGKIVIDVSIYDHDSLALICLLHEMIHAKLESTYVGGASSEDGIHGMIYQAEIVRLFHAGAYDGLL